MYSLLSTVSSTLQHQHQLGVFNIYIPSATVIWKLRATGWFSHRQHGEHSWCGYHWLSPCKRTIYASCSVTNVSGVTSFIIIHQDQGWSLFQKPKKKTLTKIWPLTSNISTLCAHHHLLNFMDFSTSKFDISNSMITLYLTSCCRWNPPLLASNWLSWFEYYLPDRSGFVAMGGASSHSHAVGCVVSQRSEGPHSIHPLNEKVISGFGISFYLFPRIRPESPS